METLVEGQRQLCLRELLYVQLPVLLLEWSILSFLLGLLLWYWSVPGRSLVGFCIIATQAALMFIFYCVLRVGEKVFKLGW
jgi:hypothetical protein